MRGAVATWIVFAFLTAGCQSNGGPEPMPDGDASQNSSSPGSCTPAGSQCGEGIELCCADSLCVIYQGVGDYCGARCSTGSECQSGCCIPLADHSANVCAPSSFCGGSGGAGGAGGTGGTGGGSCGEPCPSGCCSPSGNICCKPPFCGGDCVGSPCCS